MGCFGCFGCFLVYFVVLFRVILDQEGERKGDISYLSIRRTVHSGYSQSIVYVLCTTEQRQRNYTNRSGDMGDKYCARFMQAIEKTSGSLGS